MLEVPAPAAQGGVAWHPLFMPLCFSCGEHYFASAHCHVSIILNSFFLALYWVWKCCSYCFMTWNINPYSLSDLFPHVVSSPNGGERYQPNYSHSLLRFPFLPFISLKKVSTYICRKIPTNWMASTRSDSLEWHYLHLPLDVDRHLSGEI